MIAFIYGTYQTIINSLRPKDIVCSNCKSQNQIVVEKKITVFHILFIPFIPTRPINTFTCKSCGNYFNLSDLDSNSKKYFNQFKSKKKIPIWLFSGPILIIFSIGWFVYNQIHHDNQMLERLKNGSQIQIIEFETEEGNYSSLKTFKITSDSVWLKYNKLEIEDYNYIDRITDSNNYSSDTTKINIQKLKEIINDGRVKAIYKSLK